MVRIEEQGETYLVEAASAVNSYPNGQEDDSPDDNTPDEPEPTDDK